MGLLQLRYDSCLCVADMNIHVHSIILACDWLQQLCFIIFIDTFHNMPMNPKTLYDSFSILVVTTPKVKLFLSCFVVAVLW